MPLLTFEIDSLETDTGRVMIVTDGRGDVRAVDWEDYEGRMHRLLQRHYGKDGYRLVPAKQHSQAWHNIKAYFAGDLEAIQKLPTATNGTIFQKKVWAALRTIPTGKTVSYGVLAAQIGCASARAVGLANGSNPIPIVVPCHRVIGANSSLTGFGGGLHRKEWLLAHEGALPAQLKVGQS